MSENEIKTTIKDAIFCAREIAGLEQCIDCRLYMLDHTWCEEVHHMIAEEMEKRQAKKPTLHLNEKSGMFVDYADGHGEYKEEMNNWWRCPCCKSVVGQRVIVHKRIHDQRKKKYCEDCGQKIDWSNTGGA